MWAGNDMHLQNSFKNTDEHKIRQMHKMKSYCTKCCILLDAWENGEMQMLEGADQGNSPCVEKVVAHL